MLAAGSTLSAPAAASTSPVPASRTHTPHSIPSGRATPSTLAMPRR